MLGEIGVTKGVLGEVVVTTGVLGNALDVLVRCKGRMGQDCEGGKNGSPPVLLLVVVALLVVVTPPEPETLVLLAVLFCAGSACGITGRFFSVADLLNRGGNAGNSERDEFNEP
jgi:hypothetical protein